MHPKPTFLSFPFTSSHAAVNAIHAALSTPEDITFTPEEEPEVEAMWQVALAGSAEQVAGRLHGLALDHRLDEIVVLCWTHDQEARRNSYRLLAKEFGLKVPATPIA